MSEGQQVRGGPLSVFFRKIGQNSLSLILFVHSKTRMVSQDISVLNPVNPTCRGYQSVLKPVKACLTNRPVGTGL